MDLLLVPFFLVFTGMAAQAEAGPSSCLPELAGAQVVEVVTRSEPRTFTHVVKTPRSGMAHPTKVQLTGSVGTTGVDLNVGFDPAFDGVSLPYTLYALMVIRDGEPIVWMDYTQGCQAPGLSFFPGRLIPLPRVKLVGDHPQKLHIMLWGRL